jgi:hypothetical protein
MASGDNDDAEKHVVDVVLSGSSMTRWVPDDTGGVEAVEHTDWTIKEVAAARCSCGRRFDSEADALEHLEAVAAAVFDPPGQLMEEDDGVMGERYCARCGELITDPDELRPHDDAAEGLWLHASCMETGGGED